MLAQSTPMWYSGPRKGSTFPNLSLSVSFGAQGAVSFRSSPRLDSFTTLKTKTVISSETSVNHETSYPKYNDGHRRRHDSYVTKLTLLQKQY